MNSLSTRFNEMIAEYKAISKTFSNNKKSTDSKINTIKSQKDLEDILKLNPDLIFNMFYDSGLGSHIYRNVSLENAEVEAIVSNFIYCDTTKFNGKDKVISDDKFEYHNVVVRAVRPVNDYVQSKNNQTLVLDFKIPKETGKYDKRLKMFYN
jgi:hypothetical protein